MNKKLNLNKYAFLNYLKGDIFVWLTCNDNYLKAASLYKELQKNTPWRWQKYGLKLDEKKITYPAPIFEGVLVGEWSRRWAKFHYRNHLIFDLEEERNTNKALIKTNELLKSKDNLIIFEAAFQYNDFNIRTDILIKTGNKIKILEVKASSFPKKLYAYDLFFQKTIIEKSNSLYKSWNYDLLLINSEFINNKKISNIEKAGSVFIESPIYSNSKSKPAAKNGVNWTIQQQLLSMNLLKGDIIEDFNPSKNFAEIKDFFLEPEQQIMNKKFDSILLEITNIQKKETIPKVNLEKKNFEGMETDYLNWVETMAGLPKENSVFKFNGVALKINKKLELYNKNIMSIDDTPISSLLPKKILNELVIKNDQDTKKYIDDLESGKISSVKGWVGVIQKHFYDKDEVFINKNELHRELLKYKIGPIYMYDFETANLAIPLVDGGRPFQQIPYQYSIHVITDPNDFDFKTMKNINHFEWIADNKETFVKDFWESLSNVFLENGEGVYVSWNKSFEKTIIRDMNIEGISDEQIKIMHKVHDETIDLRDSFSAPYYYHKDFQGGSSIKKVGPHFEKTIRYDELNNVQKGDQSALFAKKWLTKKISEDDWKDIKNDMLKYCEYDTLLMVAILQRLKEKRI